MKKLTKFYREHHRYILPALALALMFAFMLVPAFAQTEPSTTTLQIDATTMTSQLFRGANFIILALGAIMFMIAGFKLGASLLSGIVNLLGNMRIGG